MIVVADTSPLHYLVLLNHVEILKELYGRVIIPTAVARELQTPKTPAGVKRWLASRPDWIEIRNVSASQDPGLAELDAGEREAIALAEELHADALIIDEKAGRREAERRKLRVIGTVRVLDDAAEAGLLNIEDALQRLESSGFYLDANLVRFIKDRDAKRSARKTQP